ncbi:MAG: HAD family hydrolase [Thermoplasmata archaeon]|nr:HAD family hydrolase [Thermoplasmata archaeon]
MNGEHTALRGRRVKAVVFDLDDTLVTSTVDYVKFRRLIIERIALEGVDPGSYNDSENIVTLLRRYREWMEGTGTTEDEIVVRMAAMDRIMDAVEMERVDETRPIDGAREVLTLLKRKGIRIGILTRGCQEYAEKALSAAGLKDLVDAVETRNSKLRPKPDPESYFRIASILGVGKDETLFVGDHIIDADCARNAGVPFVGVLSGSVSREVLLESGSVEVFETVGEMAPWLEEMLQQSNKERLA